MFSYASLQHPFINKGNLQVHGPYGFSHNLPTCMDDASIGIIIMKILLVAINVSKNYQRS